MMDRASPTHEEPAEALQDAADEVEEIVVDIEDEMVLLQGSGWHLYLSAEEARLLSQALRDAADDAEGPASDQA